MRMLKSLALAAVAALAVMAFVGATSAMAENTQLCTVETSPCPSGNVVTHVHATDPLALLHAEGFGILIDLLCEALFLGTVLALGAPQITHGEFTFSGPMGAGGPCVNMKSNGTTENCQSVKEVGTLGGLLSGLKEGTELGSAIGSEFEILTECAGFHCIYKAEGLKGHALGPLLAGGGSTGNVSIANKEVKKVSGFLCPENSHLTTTGSPLIALYGVN
jgi:hypothetical protein